MSELARRLEVKNDELKRLLEPIGQWNIQREDHILDNSVIKNYPSKKAVKFFTELANLLNNNIMTCAICGITEWFNFLLVNIAEKDHIDGNPPNNVIENLRTVCPNCHSHTTTRFKIQESHSSRFETCLSTKNVITSEEDILDSNHMKKRLKTQKGSLRPSPSNANSLQDIIDGKVSNYRTVRYLDGLIGAGYKKKRM
jgi:RNA polymerase subunit RPABC4/transcription elongation factor Spt4